MRLITWIFTTTTLRFLAIYYLWLAMWSVGGTLLRGYDGLIIGFVVGAVTAIALLIIASHSYQRSVRKSYRSS